MRQSTLVFDSPVAIEDRMLRKACGSFVLRVAGELPGDSEVEKPYGLHAVFKWLRELPEQIERTIVTGG